MSQKNPTPRRSSVIDADTGSGGGHVAAHPHDSGSAANETVDGLDATTEALRHAAEDTPSGAGSGDISRLSVVTAYVAFAFVGAIVLGVFLRSVTDRCLTGADLAPKI